MSMVEEIGAEVVDKVDGICRTILEGGTLDGLKGETLIVFACVVGTLSGFAAHHNAVAAGVTACKKYGDDHAAVDNAIMAAEIGFDETVKMASDQYRRRAIEASNVREDSKDVA